MVKKSLIEEIAKKIEDNFQPEKIILFGSYAWGKPNNNSDIDLFLIMNSKLRRDKRAIEVQKIFSERTFPMDIIVYTPQEIKESLKRKNPFISKIIHEGSVLYG